MDSVTIMYGNDFWLFFDKAVKNAKNHVFIFTAYTNEKDLAELINVTRHLPHLIIVRDDLIKVKPVFVNDNVIFTNHQSFHAKVYVIDNYIIVGSQNLYRISTIPLEQKTGEISIGFQSDDVLNIIYQSLMIVLRNEYELYYNNELELFYDQYEELSQKSFWILLFQKYKLDSFLNLKSGICPNCGSRLSFKEIEENLYDCNTYGVVKQSECEEGNACKYCIEKHLHTPQISYWCNNCNFMVGYCTEELQKSPYYCWNSLICTNSPNELECFLKLYFYLIKNLGENKTNFILSSLKILGNLSSLNISKRNYVTNALSPL